MVAGSTVVLALHCFLLQGLLTLAFGSVALKAWNPHFYDNVFFPVYVLTSTLTIIGWSPRFGGCYLTKLEKQLRVKENKPIYTRTFILHYLDEWFRIKVHPKVITWTLVSIMLVPVLVRYFG